MYFDFHIHSRYSFDALMKPEKIIKIAKKRGLNGIAITDHNTIKGSMEAIKITKNEDFMVISGAEIATDCGDIIGLYIDDEIKSRKCLEVIDEIHAQGGIVILPHPYKGHTLNNFWLSQIDLIEVFNARCSYEQNAKAVKLAQKIGKPGIAGSDAHLSSEIGICKTIIESNNVRERLINSKISMIVKQSYPYRESISQSIKFGRNYGPISFSLYLGQAIIRFLQRKKY